ncbi:MAG: hypothetical protein ACI8RD_008166, partial [Bacillariaceae sp.]
SNIIDLSQRNNDSNIYLNKNMKRKNSKLLIILLI